jgi:hypothetical protein
VHGVTAGYDGLPGEKVVEQHSAYLLILWARVFTKIEGHLEAQVVTDAVDPLGRVVPGEVVLFAASEEPRVSVVYFL